MSARELGRKAIKVTNSVVNGIVLTIIVLLLFLVGYALWDSEQIYRAADKSSYEVYKPTIENEGRSFKELQAINAEVFAWLTVYGTNIDYPVTQGYDNMKYVNTNAEGLYSLTGSIFLDYRNSKDFSDFNSILYGHHMQKQVQFGEIGDFSDKEKFDSLRYGNLYFNGKDHGIEFFAFIHTTAYDSAIYKANIEEGKRQVYLDSLLEKSMHTRDIGVTIDDRIVLLSTCSTDSTNGRDILIGRLSSEVYEDQTTDAEITAGEKEQWSLDNPGELFEKFPLLLPILIVILAVLLIVMLLLISRRRKQNRGKDS